MSMGNIPILMQKHYDENCKYNPTGHRKGIYTGYISHMQMPQKANHPANDKSELGTHHLISGGGGG